MNCKLICGLLFVILNVWFCQCSSNYGIPYQQLIADVPVQEGYEIKYSFKDHHYLDIVITPSPNLNDWLAITLEKSLTGGNKISLQTYNGKDFDYIENIDSSGDVGHCKKINSLVYNGVIFLVVSRCSISSNKTEIFVIDELKLSLINLQTLPYSFVEDAEFWINSINGDLNLIVLRRPELGSRKPGVLYHFVYNKEFNIFEKYDEIKNIDPRSMTIFVVDNTTYIGVANYQDLIGDFVKSNIYAQNKQTGKLMKHQELTSKGAISFTYFCFISETKFEHFLLSANNMHLRGPFGTKKTLIRKGYVEESLLFKWDNGYFIPFQTLLVKVPSPWIMVPSDSNVLVLITWSYVDGMVSYQYDGWRFQRTSIRQTDSTYESPHFAHFQLVSISGETLFTIFTSKNGAKRKYFIVPKYRNNVQTRVSYYEKESWCKNTNLELRLAWDIFSPHYQYLTSLGPGFSTDISLEEKIMSLFGLIFGYNALPRKQTNGLEIMSLEGPPPSEDMFRTRTSEYPECKMNYEETKLPEVTHVVVTKHGFLTLEQSGIIEFHPLSHWKTSRDPSKGKKIYEIKNVTKITDFHSVELCSQPGLYIAGIKNGEFFGKVYTIHMRELKLYRSLKLEGSSKVRSLCSKLNVDCFVIISTDEPKCSLQCPGVTTYFSCDTDTQVETLNLDSYSVIVSTSNNEISQSSFDDLHRHLSTVSLKKVHAPSKLYLKVLDEDLFMFIVNENEVSFPTSVEVCRLNEQSENEIMNITCSEALALPPNYKYITLGIVKKELALFVGTNDTISITLLSNNYVMIIDKLININYNSFEHFVVKKANFLVLKEENNSIIVEFQYC